MQETLLLFVVIALVLGSLAFRSLRHFVDVWLRRGPHSIESSIPMDAPNLPPELITPHQRLIGSGFALVGAEYIRLHRRSRPRLGYIYVSRSGYTFAEVTVMGRGKAFLGLFTRFHDDALIWTTYPQGENITTDRLIARYARDDMDAAFRHHQAATARWKPTKGNPVRIRTLSETQDASAWFRHVHGRQIYRRVAGVRLIVGLLYAVAAGFAAYEAMHLWNGGAQSMRSLLAFSGLLIVGLEGALGNWLRRPPGALDRQPAAQRRWVARVLGVVPLLAFLTVIGVLVANPRLLTTTLDLVSIRQQSGQDWVTIPLPGDRAVDLEVVQGELWALTGTTLALWNPLPRTWQTVYTTDDNAQDMAIGEGGNTIWVLTQAGIAQCEAAARACSHSFNLADGTTIAAHGADALAVTTTGYGAFFTAGRWTNFSLFGLLTRFEIEDAPGHEATAIFTHDGTAWIEWGQVWRRPVGDERWALALYDQPPPVRLDIIGTTPDHLWTLWGNGLSRDDPDLRNWDFFDWQALGGEYAGQVFDLAADPDGSVWFGTHRGLLHNTGDDWELLPIAGISAISEVATASDGALWIQTINDTTAGLPNAVLIPVVGVLLIVLFRAFTWLAQRAVG